MKKLTQEEVLEKIKKVHGNKYDYDKFVYVNMRTKAIITCPIHGDFEQKPQDHIGQGHGCRECKRYSRLDSVRLTTEQFIEKAKAVHKDKYDYPLVEYKNNKTKVKIICKKHGIFEQSPNSHLMGAGCMKCGDKAREEKMQNHPRGWSYTNWQKRGENSENFDSFKVYILRCWNDEEEFYKVGKTFRKIEERFPTKFSLPYNYEILKIFKGAAQEISKLESEIQKNNKKYSYKPKIKFFGLKECFSTIKY